MKKPIALFSLALLFALLGCRQEDVTIDPCAEHEKAVCTTDANKANIRLRNVSTYDYCNVQANICCGTVNHGNLAAGATTCYRAYDQAWRFASFNFSVGADSFQLQIIDHVGDSLLPPGNYTFELNVLNLEKRQCTEALVVD